MTGLPHAESDIHHHGTGATIVYALNGVRTNSLSGSLLTVYPLAL